MSGRKPRLVEMAVPDGFPAVRVARYASTGELYTGIKDRLSISLVERGSSEWWLGGRSYESAPGSIAIKQPGDVHRDLRRDGPSRFQVVSLDDELLASARQALGAPRAARRAPAQVHPRHPHAAVFGRLHRVLASRDEDPLAVGEALADALSALVSELYAGGDPEPDPGRRFRVPVRRALELLHARWSERLTLETLADHARLDKFHLCRAFRAEVGLPPHAYLTHLRVNRAKALLASGVAPGAVAASVGLCDQSQLNRHFRRIVRMTPGEFGRAVGGVGPDRPRSRHPGHRTARRETPAARATP